MGIAFRHVVWASATLSLGAFLYVVTLEPMDTETHPRAAAIDQVRMPNRVTLIRDIRRSMSRGQLDEAMEQVRLMVRLEPDDPATWYYGANIARSQGNEEIESRSWRRLNNLMGRLVGWNGRYTLLEIQYYKAWGEIGMGRIEEAQWLFRTMADEYEKQSRFDSDLSAGEHYNLACYRSMSGQQALAMAHWARAVEQGYGAHGNDNGWWLVDPDLEPLHGVDAFWEIAQPLLDMRGERDQREQITTDEPEVDGHDDPDTEAMESVQPGG
jgi:tetratricopeptide (TPR) repeat protein